MLSGGFDGNNGDPAPGELRACSEVALRERVSGTGEPTRGIGLYGVADEMRQPGRQLVIHSGIGSLRTTEEMETKATRTTLFPGTLTYGTITT